METKEMDYKCSLSLRIKRKGEQMDKTLEDIIKEKEKWERKQNAEYRDVDKVSDRLDTFFTCFIVLRDRVTVLEEMLKEKEKENR